MSDADLAERALAAGLKQPDSTTCGSCVLVVSRMLHDPAYARLVVEGTDTDTGQQAGGTLQQRFCEQALATHRLTSGGRDSRGRWQPPWPRSLGTQPWALAREMTARAGRTGTSYDVVPILPSRRRRVFARMAALTSAGNHLPLYVGNRWSPRHVVLVLASSEPPGDELRLYDPASGRRSPVPLADFAAASLSVAGWSHPWAVVVPT